MSISIIDSQCSKRSARQHSFGSTASSTGRVCSVVSGSSIAECCGEYTSRVVHAPSRSNAARRTIWEACGQGSVLTPTRSSSDSSSIDVLIAMWTNVNSCSGETSRSSTSAASSLMPGPRESSSAVEDRVAEQARDQVAEPHAIVRVEPARVRP